LQQASGVTTYYNKYESLAIDRWANHLAKLIPSAEGKHINDLAIGYNLMYIQ
jgi:hypothetical protein